MKVISINVGLPRLVEHNGEMIATGIYKSPVADRIKVNEINLDGDAQADLRFHGGWSKAVYAYASEHYEFWRSELPDADLTFGAFGENLTTVGLFENETFIGDKLRIGSAEFIVTEPRFPCFKLGIKFGRKDIIRRFQKARRSGIYLAIAKTGEIAAGDAVEVISRNEQQVSILDLLRLHDEQNDLETAKRAVKVESLPKKWRESLLALIEEAESA